MSAFVISETRDKALLAEFFRTERSLYAYLLGDLDPFFFDKSRWWVACENSQVQAAILSYEAFATPVLIGLAENPAQSALWRYILKKPIMKKPIMENPPHRAHIHYRKEHESLLVEAGAVEPLGTYLKMVWSASHASSKILNIDLSEVVELGPSDIESIRELHASASPGAYFDERLLATGLCFGIWRESVLVAFSGCHVYSKEYSVAAMGAIATHPEFRRKGLGAKVSLCLLNALKTHIDCIGLNVHSENVSAIKIYERLGFQRHCEYEEAIFSSGAADK